MHAGETHGTVFMKFGTPIDNDDVITPANFGAIGQGVGAWRGVRFSHFA